MFKIKGLLDKHHEEIARITTQEHGKAIDEARGETLRSIENVETAAGITSLMMGYNLEDGAAKNIDETVVRQPLGVFACVSPFNFPGMVPFWFWPYAVATGNTFVIKVSEQTPLTLTRTFEILQDADLPDGVLNLVHGDKEAVDAILDSPLVKGVTFVGSTPVAKYLYARCGETGKRCIAQAGAKNFLTVMPDAEIDRSTGNMMASFFGCTGQRCLAGANLMAVGDVYEELKEKFVAAAAALKVGPGLDESVNMGPIISQEEPRARAQLHRHGRQAGRRGAARRARHRRAGLRGRLLHRPDRARQGDAGHDPRPGGDLRAGGVDHPCQGPGGVDQDHQRLALRQRRLDLHHQRPQRAARSGTRCRRATSA